MTKTLLISLFFLLLLLSCQDSNSTEQQIINHLEGSSHVYGGHCSKDCNVVEQVMNEETMADSTTIIKHYYIFGTYKGIEFEAYMDTTIGFGIKNKVVELEIKDE